MLLTIRDKTSSGAVASNGVPSTQTQSFEFFVLTGDLNRDGTVGFGDLLTVAQNFGQSGMTFSQGNVDYSPDGLIGFTDLLLVAQLFGNTAILGSDE